MPKIIDHEQRRIKIAEAAWKIVRRDGVAGVTVRAVAAETALATASLRRSFPTQTLLLGFCFELIIERATQRIAALPEKESPRERVEQILLEVLPLDPERHAEMQVWLAFATASMAEPELATIYARGHTDLHDLCVSAIRALDVRDDAEGEALRLHALLDGLALHLVAPSNVVTHAAARAVLVRHLDTLSCTKHEPL